MKNGITRFLRSLMRFFLFKKKPVKTSLLHNASKPMTMEQSIHLINDIGNIMREEAAKRGMNVEIQIMDNAEINPMEKTQDARPMGERSQLETKKNSNVKGKP